MAFTPIPCATCGQGGSGAAGLDAERQILCDVDAVGNVIGTALMVTLYDAAGAPTGPPSPVSPVTGLPYVAVGTLQPCPGETGCLEPVQFCFTSTSTGNVEHPGRQYDASIPLNPGFALESIVIDGVVTPQNLVWDVNDAAGQVFADELETRLHTLLPNAGTIVVTPPAGGQNCGNPATSFAVHIECLRLDQEPPDVIRFNYNGGEDLIQNPAYNETPPLSPPVSQGNYGYHLLARQDDPGPFPGFPPSGRANCTNVANRGWETNDSGRTFEIWGADVSVGVTPTPRGTPIQEVNSDGNPGDGGTTIWQTFQVTTGGNFNIRLVHGARDPGETHTIRLSTGDTGPGGSGDLINNVTSPPVVYGGAWTTLNQVVALAPGLYTLSFKSDNPTGNPARGGLFTDMRAFVDVPGLFVDAGRTDGDCVVLTQETETTTVCQYWSPVCVSGDITEWKNAETGETLDNAAFWGQTPSPECCTAQAASGGGTVTPGNLVHAYLVCGVVGGVPTTLTRVVYTNQSGGVVAGAFIGADGGPVNPATWTPGACVVPQLPLRDTELVQLCDSQPGGAIVPFVRRMTFDGNGAIVSASNIDANGAIYVPTGNVGLCGTGSVGEFVLCDVFTVGGNPLRVSFVRKFFQNDDGVVTNTVDLTFNGDPYVVQGLVGDCSQSEFDSKSQILCDANGTQFLRVYRQTSDENVFDTINYTLAGAPFVPVGAVGICGQTSAYDSRDAEVLVLCDATPTRFLRKYLYDGETGAAVGFVNTTLDGTTPFAPVGAVGLCTTPVATDFDFVVTTLCDANGTAFLQRLTFNSATGAVTSTTNTTLQGAPFAPVGAVSVCSNCCPIEIGQGCYTGGSGHYTAIRQPGGTISLIDSVSGAAVLAANVVPCPSDDIPVTLNSQHRLIADADAAWTPGADVAGTLTSVTYTVLTGTATVVDQSGTSAAGLPAGLTATWTAEDGDVLLGPQSIDAVGGLTYVVWTQR